MGRYFKKISFEQFKKDISNDQELYEKYLLPKRSTKNSAGYDFYAINDVTIMPGESVKIPLGVKCCMNEDEVLMLFIRSSMGFKYNIRMCNQVGIIDSDYYDNTDNEGHIWIKIKNEGDQNFEIKRNDAICQGIFTRYLIVDDEEEILNERIGGLGSTNEVR